ncbi:polysaccharide pyruvyl transferase [Shewanella chilikensis]|uniref:Polysaccharide pyruvyl transferase n=2 Tax=Shewanella chilikensis TaxID=558541 RepID=A0ABX5PLZ2_9GAMM|nr:polysaccharide pyruvyl transferase [Shewanella chilikensis]
MLSGFSLLCKMIFCDKFYVSGGNIFSYERPRSIIKVVSFFLLFNFRHLIKKETIVDSVGLNLRVGYFWRLILVLTLRKVNEAYLRDNLSFRFLRMFSPGNIYFRHDRVYRNAKNIRSYKKQLQSPGSLCEDKYCIWFLSETAIDKDNVDSEVKLIKEIVASGYCIKFLVQEKSDEVRLNSFINSCSCLKGRYKKINYAYSELGTILLEIERADFSITERYHGALLSEVFSVKWLPFSQSEKLNRLDVGDYKLNKLPL